MSDPTGDPSRPHPTARRHAASDPAQPLPAGYQPPPGYQLIPIPQASHPQPPAPAAKKKRHPVLGFLIILAVIIIGIAISQSGGSPKTPAGAALAGSASTAGGSAPAPSTSEAAPSTTAAPIPPPITYKGRGDDVLSITKPAGDGPVVATIVGNKAGGANLAVLGMDGDKDLLVNTTDPYSGSTLMDINGGTTTKLQVTATGPWSIMLSDPRTAPQLDSGPTHGTGDTVLVYRGGGGTATISGGTASGSNFAVQEYANAGQNLLVNETSAYQGTVPLQAGPSIIVVTATGPWSITVG